MDLRSAMAPWRANLRAFATLLVCACAGVAGQALAQTYTVVDVATLAQGTASVVRGPNLGGTAVGGGRLASPGSPRQGLVFEPAGVLTIGGLPGSDFSNVLGVNDLGALVGAANTAAAVRAFAATRAGAGRELPPLPGDTASVAYAINNAGQAVGYSSGPGGERAVSWTVAGEPVALAGAAGESNRAYAVNQRGDAVGVVGASTARRATLWPAGGGAQQLGPLPGFEASEAAWINASGDVVGHSATAAEVRRATLWPAGGAPVDLGVLAGGTFSQAFGINDAGNIVGSSGSADGARAFIWTRTGGLQDLNGLLAAGAGVVLTKAVGINNQGVVIALGHEPQAGTHDHEQPVRVLRLIPSGG